MIRWGRWPFIAAAIGWTALPAVAGHGQMEGAGKLAPLSVGRVRALVISPHPDDATLGAAGLVQRVIRNGGSVQIVQMTGGDAFPRGVMTIKPRVPITPVAYRWYGSLREREVISAFRVLGIHRAQIRLLGFPDEGLCALASTYRIGAAFESPYTRRESPPEAEQIVRGTMYRGDDLVRELAQLIQQFRPTLIVVAHSGDLHPDHCATHLLVHQALDEAVERGLAAPRVLHYVVHYPQWPSGKGEDGDLDPPSSELTRGWEWRTLGLTSRERAAKEKALGVFRSQMLVMPGFLKSFARANELFIEGESPLPIPCWCGGENIAVATRVH